MLSEGSKYNVSYIAEDTFGTTPETPSMRLMRVTTDGLNGSKESFLSNELRSDREITDFRHGNRRVNGPINFELAKDQSFEDFMLALLGDSAWHNAVSVTGTTYAFVNGAPDTITDSGNGFVTAGFKVGDVITVTGDSVSGNNATYTLTGVSAGTLTVSGTVLVDDAAGDTVTITAARKYAKIGTTIKSFSIERRWTDIGLYQLISGARVNTMALSVKPNSIVTGNFGIMAKDWGNSASSVDVSPDAASSTSVFDSFSGTILEGGAAIAIVTGIDLNINNNLDPAFVVGDATMQQLFEQRCTVSGSITVYLKDETLLEKFKNETVSSIEFKLSDGTNYYTYILPRLKYGDASAPVNGFGGIIVTLPFQAYRDPTVGASLRIEKSS